MTLFNCRVTSNDASVEALPSPLDSVCPPAAEREREGEREGERERERERERESKINCAATEKYATQHQLIELHQARPTKRNRY